MESVLTAMEESPDGSLSEAERKTLRALIAQLPPADALCPFCIVLRAEPWPEYASERLCAEHLPLALALQCKGWNQDRWHQRLAGLARHGLLPQGVNWWPQTPDELAAAVAVLDVGRAS